MPRRRTREELPYFDYLTSESGVPEHGEKFDIALFEGTSFDGIHAGQALFVESAFARVRFGDANLRKSTFNDVWLDGCDITDADLTETTWLDTEVGTTIMAGTAFCDATLSRVGFFGCKLLGTNFRGARLQDVTFTDCVMRDVDFGDAALVNIAFPGSTVSALHLDNARCKNTDLRSAAEIDIQSGYDSLRGVRISSGQLLDLAPAFAQALGVLVED